MVLVHLAPAILFCLLNCCTTVFYCFFTVQDLRFAGILVAGAEGFPRVGFFNQAITSVFFSVFIGFI